MFRKPILASFAASVISAGLLAGAPAKADGIVSFDVGSKHVCIGVWSCLFKPAKKKPRDENGTADHRGDIIDQDPIIDQDVSERRQTIVAGTTQIRDHRTKVTVRDHRK
jgi:hypothetical protein